MAKVHGSLNGAGRVKNFTRDLKMEKLEKPVHPPRGRAGKRAQYKRRIINAVILPNGRRASCNPQNVPV